MNLFPVRIPLGVKNPYESPKEVYVEKKEVNTLLSTYRLKKVTKDGHIILLFSISLQADKVQGSTLYNGRTEMAFTFLRS